MRNQSSRRTYKDKTVKPCFIANPYELYDTTQLCSNGSDVDGKGTAAASSLQLHHQHQQRQHQHQQQQQHEHAESLAHVFASSSSDASFKFIEGGAQEMMPGSTAAAATTTTTTITVMTTTNVAVQDDNDEASIRKRRKRGYSTAVVLENRCCRGGGGSGGEGGGIPSTSMMMKGDSATAAATRAYAADSSWRYDSRGLPTTTPPRLLSSPSSLLRYVLSVTTSHKLFLAMLLIITAAFIFNGLMLRDCAVFKTRRYCGARNLRTITRADMNKLGKEKVFHKMNGDVVYQWIVQERERLRYDSSSSSSSLVFNHSAISHPASRVLLSDAVRSAGTRPLPFLQSYEEWLRYYLLYVPSYPEQPLHQHRQRRNESSPPPLSSWQPHHPQRHRGGYIDAENTMKEGDIIDTATGNNKRNGDGYNTAIMHKDEASAAAAPQRRTRIAVVSAMNNTGAFSCLSIASAVLSDLPIYYLGFHSPYSHIERYERYLQFIEIEGLEDSDVLVALDSDIIFSGVDARAYLAYFVATTAPSRDLLDVVAVRSGQVPPPMLFSSERYCMHQQLYDTAGCIARYDELERRIVKEVRFDPSGAYTYKSNAGARQNPFRYLNGGAVIARVWALKALYAAVLTFSHTRAPELESPKWYCDQTIIGELYLSLRHWELDNNLVKLLLIEAELSKRERSREGLLLQQQLLHATAEKTQTMDADVDKEMIKGVKEEETEEMDREREVVDALEKQEELLRQQRRRRRSIELEADIQMRRDMVARLRRRFKDLTFAPYNLPAGLFGIDEANVFTINGGSETIFKTDFTETSYVSNPCERCAWRKAGMEFFSSAASSVEAHDEVHGEQGLPSFSSTTATVMAGSSPDFSLEQNHESFSLVSWVRMLAESLALTLTHMLIYEPLMWLRGYRPPTELSTVSRAALAEQHKFILLSISPSGYYSSLLDGTNEIGRDCARVSHDENNQRQQQQQQEEERTLAGQGGACRSKTAEADKAVRKRLNALAQAHTQTLEHYVGLRNLRQSRTGAFLAPPLTTSLPYPSTALFHPDSTRPATNLASSRHLDDDDDADDIMTTTAAPLLFSISEKKQRLAIEKRLSDFRNSIAGVVSGDAAAAAASSSSSPSRPPVFPVGFHFSGGWKEYYFPIYRHFFSWYLPREHSHVAARRMKEVLSHARVRMWMGDYEETYLYTDLCGYPF